MLGKTLLQACTDVRAYRLCILRRFVSTTNVNFLNQKWRQQRGLPVNPNACGVLTDGPDYTYLDGRPTPYGIRQRNRVIKQEKLVEDVIRLSAEVDFAVERHEKLQQEEKKRRQNILDNKLKPKGIELLKKKH